MFTINIKHFVRLKSIQRPVFTYSKLPKLKSNEERVAALKEQRLNSIRKTIISSLRNRKLLPVSEWKTIIAELQKNPEFRNKSSLSRDVFDVLLSLGRSYDSVQMARNFIESFELPYDIGVKRSIIQLYARKASMEKLTEAEEKELIDLCNEFIAQGLHVLKEMHSIIVIGFCATKEWKKALDVPDPALSSLNILARKTLLENDMEATWKILSNLTRLNEHYQHLASKTIVAFAKYFERNPKDIPQNAEKLFEFCEGFKTVFDEPTMREMINVLQRSGHDAKITSMDNSGMCQNCRSNLQVVRVKNEDFITLQNEFMNNVVKGVDINQKTTPEEWQAFERTIKEEGPFDIVVDGLNVAYTANERNKHFSNLNKHRMKQIPCAHSLANVVSQLTREGKRVLVIGRKHMDRWPRMHEIGQKATVFLVDNVSKDDVFLLYGAIASGPNSYILSNDYMRQHRFAIGKQYNALFKQWQQEHWYGFRIGKTKPIDLIKPMAFKMYCHKTGNFWHLPFKSNAEIESKTFNQYEQPKHWACVRIKEHVSTFR